MTDGIIQQVIDLHNKNECKCKHACHNLLRIQQELIEKIKQEFQPLEEDQYELTFKQIRQKLIGDNKE